MAIERLPHARRFGSPDAARTPGRDTDKGAVASIRDWLKRNGVEP